MFSAAAPITLRKSPGEPVRVRVKAEPNTSALMRILQPSKLDADTKTSWTRVLVEENGVMVVGFTDAPMLGRSGGGALLPSTDAKHVAATDKSATLHCAQPFPLRVGIGTRSFVGGQHEAGEDILIDGGDDAHRPDGSIAYHMSWLAPNKGYRFMLTAQEASACKPM